ncbi:unnamed protein product [Cuscuta campestris]|uniref:Uncharacterized protein n=1 Tax=Cuscuta campestris TaxID=132261 RepID=A0A484LG86_9ASTE|nr:unnamed protein product [Cuscuta campestris]
MDDIMGAESHVEFRADVVVGDGSCMVGGSGERRVGLKADVAGGGRRKQPAVKEYPPPMEVRREMKRRYTKDGRLVLTAEPSEFYVLDGSDHQLRRLNLLGINDDGEYPAAGDGSSSGMIVPSIPPPGPMPGSYFS